MIIKKISPNITQPQNFGARRMPDIVPVKGAAARFFKDIRDISVLTPNLEKILAKAVREGTLKVPKIPRTSEGISGVLEYLAGEQTGFKNRLQSISKEVRPKLKTELQALNKGIQEINAERQGILAEKAKAKAEAEKLAKAQGKEDDVVEEVPKKLLKKGQKAAEQSEEVAIEPPKLLSNDPEFALISKVRALSIKQAELTKELDKLDPPKPVVVETKNPVKTKKVGANQPTKADEVEANQPAKAEAKAKEKAKAKAKELEYGAEELADDAIKDDGDKFEYVKDANAERRAKLFAKHNLRLVVSIAKRFQHTGVPLPDLVDDGSIGLMRAVDSFDERLGFKFSTYATWWIRQAITRALIDTGRIIRVPVHMADAQRHLGKVQRMLAAKLGKKPTLEELAAEMELKPEKVEKIIASTKIQPTSLDKPIVSDGGGFTLADIVPDHRAEEDMRKMELSGLGKLFANAFAKLKPIEAEVLKRRFGLNGYREQTLQEAGEELRLTRERIRQIEAKALRKLRKSALRKDVSLHSEM